MGGGGGGGGGAAREPTLAVDGFASLRAKLERPCRVVRHVLSNVECRPSTDEMKMK